MTEEINSQISRSINDFSIIQHNIRGINSKIGDIKYLIDKTFFKGTPDCMVLCETWLNAHSPEVKIPGYDFVHTDSVGKRGGGVGILISEAIKYKECKDIKLDSIECESCFIEVKTKTKSILVGSIY